MPQLGPILWSLFPFVLVLSIILVMVSLFYDDDIVGGEMEGLIVAKVIGW